MASRPHKISVQQCKINFRLTKKLKKITDTEEQKQYLRKALMILSIGLSLHFWSWTELKLACVKKGGRISICKRTRFFTTTVLLLLTFYCHALRKGVWKAHWLCGYCWKFPVNLFIKLLSSCFGIGTFLN